jgi:predicted transcriptional regulator
MTDELILEFPGTRRPATELERDVYALSVATPGITTGGLAERLKRDVVDVARAVTTLAEAGRLRVTREDAGA